MKLKQKLSSISQFIFSLVRGVAGKIALIIIFSSTVTVGIGTYALKNMGIMRDSTADLYYQNISVIFPISEMQDLVYKNENTVNTAMSGSGLVIINASRSRSNLYSQFNQMKAYITEQEVETLEQTLENYGDALEAFDNAYNYGEGDVKATYNEFARLSRLLFSELSTVHRNHRTSGTTSFARSNLAYEKVVKIQRWIILVGVIISMVLGFLEALSIIKPLRKLKAAAEQLAKGDLQVNVAINSRNEVGMVATAFNTAVDALRSLVTSAQDSARNINTSAGDLSSVADSTTAALKDLNDLVEHLSDGATTQSQVVDETLQIMETASKGTEMVTNATLEINNTCQELSQLAARGGNATEDMTNAIDSFVNTVKDIDGVVQNLAEKSREIQQLLDVIHDIAEKTTMLSLNASIEAARAGEHGRGFAIVAHHIRQLSERSRESIEHINEVINNIFEETDRAVSAVERGTSQVEKGRVTLDDTIELFKELVRQVDQITHRISQIAETASQVSENNKSVINEMGKVAEISQNNLAAVEEVSATFQEQYASSTVVADAARKLRELAEELTATADRFIVE